MSQRGEIDNIVLAAVQKMAPVTRAELRIALRPLTDDQVDGGLSRTMRRGLIASVARADIAPRGPAGRRYMLSSEKAAPKPVLDLAPGHHVALLKAPSEVCPHGWPPNFVSRWPTPSKRGAA